MQTHFASQFNNIGGAYGLRKSKYAHVHVWTPLEKNRPVILATLVTDCFFWKNIFCLREGLGHAQHRFSTPFAPIISMPSLPRGQM